jgi:hypothetical protein
MQRSRAKVFLRILSLTFQQGGIAMKPSKDSPNTTTFWIFLILTVLAGCKESTNSPTELASNAPVVAVVPNAFTYVIFGDNFTASVNNDLSFTTDSLVYSMVVAKFGGGSATFTVWDASGNTVLRDSVFTTKVNAVVQSGKGIPKRCTLGFQNFSGQMTLSFAANKGPH